MRTALLIAGLLLLPRTVFAASGARTTLKLIDFALAHARTLPTIRFGEVGVTLRIGTGNKVSGRLDWNLGLHSLIRFESFYEMDGDFGTTAWARIHF